MATEQKKVNTVINGSMRREKTPMEPGSGISSDLGILGGGWTWGRCVGLQGKAFHGFICLYPNRDV